MDEILEGVFESWKSDARETMVNNHWKANARPDLLEELVDNLIKLNVDYKLAYSLKNKLKDCLVTKKGQTGSGNYKNWKECVESEYLKVLFDVYNSKGLIVVEDGGSITQTSLQSNLASLVSFEQHPLIELWGEKKFENLWGKELSGLTHQKDSSLHNRFLDEMFG